MNVLCCHLTTLTISHRSQRITLNYKTKATLTFDRQPVSQQLNSTQPSKRRRRRYTTSIKTEKRLDQLKEFKNTHGHAFVPYSDPSGLGRWISEQRHRYQKGLVDVDIYRELSAIGVPLRAQEARWDAKYSELKEYLAVHGHVCVKHREGDSESLYAWVLQQRQLRKQGRLDGIREAKLNALGFVWDVQARVWRENMEHLEVFFREHGHCRVYRGWDRHPTLYCWMRRVQSSSKKRFDDVPFATQEDIDRLYEWGAVKGYRMSWEERYLKLRHVREVSQKSGKVQYDMLRDLGLFSWCRSQRFAYRQGTLHEDRLAKLESIHLAMAGPDSSSFRWLLKK